MGHFLQLGFIVFCLFVFNQFGLFGSTGRFVFESVLFSILSEWIL